MCKELLLTFRGFVGRAKEIAKSGDKAWKMKAIQDWENLPLTKERGVEVVKNGKNVPLWVDLKKGSITIALDENVIETTTEYEFTKWLERHFLKGTGFALLYTNIFIQLLDDGENPRHNFCVLAGTPINLRNVIE